MLCFVFEQEIKLEIKGKGGTEKWSHLYNVVVSSRLMRLVIFGVFEQHFVHVCGGVLEQLVGAAEDDQSDLAVAQHRQLVGFLHQTELALGECHLHTAHTHARV